MKRELERTSKMAARTLELICTRSKLSNLLSQLGLHTEPTIDQVKEQATDLTAERLSIIMKQGGLSLEQISLELEVAQDVLNQILTQDQPQTDATYVTGAVESSPSHFSRSTPEDFKEPAHPQFIYCYSDYELMRTNLDTEVRSSHIIPNYMFYEQCRVSEMPGGSLLLTEGWNGRNSVREVDKIDTLREIAVSSQPPMHTARCTHAAVHHSQYLYVLGGYSPDSDLKECERYVCTESRWEGIPALPIACFAMSAVVLDNCLYALGGMGDDDLDTVQKLSLDSLTWELMELKLPLAASDFPCFKSDTQVYLLINKTLYSFTPLQDKPIKTVSESFSSCTSYYNRGTLYYDAGGLIMTLDLNIY
jgi:hypothetical protein